MKKIFVILLVLCLVLAGCNNQTDSISSKELSSSDFSSTHSSSNVSKFESSSNINVSSELAEEVIEEGGACGNIEFHASFESTDEFIQWAKIGGENTDWSFSKSKDNPCSLFFLDWRKNKSEMVIPKLKNNEYYLRVASADDDHLEFRFFLKNEPSNTSKPDVINIFGFPLTEEQKSLSLKELTEMFNPMEDIYYGDSVWGEYIPGTEYSIAITLGFVKSSMFFVVKPAGMIENTINPWQEEYFDYFDFETVSLK